jgi:hypothetical protein
VKNNPEIIGAGAGCGPSDESAFHLQDFHAWVHAQLRGPHGAEYLSKDVRENLESPFFSLGPVYLDPKRGVPRPLD